MKKIIVIVTLLVIIACSTSPSQPEGQQPTAARVLISQLPTSTDIPTAIIAPTEVIAPTAEQPTADPNPIMAPVYYSGTGDSVIEVQPLPQPLVATHIKGNEGSRHFAVTPYYNDGTTGLLVNVTEPYNGITLVSSADQLKLLEVKAEGEWAIGIYDVRAMQAFNSSAYIYGTGDSLILINLDKNTVHVVGNTQSRHFSMTAYTLNSYPDLLINKTDPYDGMVLLPESTYLLEVKAAGEWFINP